LRNSIFERRTLFSQNKINIRFEVHDPAMVLRYRTITILGNLSMLEMMARQDLLAMVLSHTVSFPIALMSSLAKLYSSYFSHRPSSVNVGCCTLTLIPLCFFHSTMYSFFSHFGSISAFEHNYFDSSSRSLHLQFTPLNKFSHLIHLFHSHWISFTHLHLKLLEIHLFDHLYYA
jgi:hypothetical protein